MLAGMWPFHTWAPTGHAAAPTAASMLLGNLIRSRTEHAQKSFRSHRSSADLNVVGLLNDCSALGEESLQLEDEFLEGQRVGFG